jgi:hypothetical protein
MTAKEIIKDLKEALKMFGTYNYYDKGVDEVFNYRPIVKELEKMSAKDAGTLMKELSAYEHGPHLVNALANDLDHMPEVWFTEMLDLSGAEY